MTAHNLRLPEAVERVLIDAAAHPGFLQALLARRLEAVEARGHVLTPSERAMLESVPEAQLRAVIDGLRDIGESLPIPGPLPMAEPASIRPDGLTGIRPEDPRVKGIRPTRLLIGAAVTTAALGSGAYYLLSLGHRADPPPVETVSPPSADAGADSRDDKAPPTR